MLMGVTAGAQQDTVRVRKVDVRVDDLLRELSATRAREDEIRRMYIELVASQAQKSTTAPRALPAEQPVAVRMVLQRLKDVSQQQIVLKRRLETLCNSAAKPKGYLGVNVTGQATIVVVGNQPVGFNFATHQLVVSVEPGSPAEKAGIHARDVLVAIGNKDLRNGDMLPSDLLPGERIFVKVERDGSTLQLPVTVEPRPESFNTAPCFMDATIATAIAPTPEATAYAFVAPDSVTPVSGFFVRSPRPPAQPTRVRGAVAATSAPDEPTPMFSAGPMVAQMNAGGMGLILGASVMPMNHDMSEIFHSEKGLLVLKVLQATPAEDAGLKGGDVLLSANDQELTTARSLERVMNLSSQHEVKLLLLRRGKQQTVTVRW